jgi:beta-glucanase (GH16 family)
MKKVVTLFFIWHLAGESLAQLSPAGCVEGHGVRYYLDAFLGSMGACNCTRSGVILTEFPKCNTNPYLLEFEDNFDGDSLDLLKWQHSPNVQGALATSQNVDLSMLRNVLVKNGICHIIARKETVKSRAISWKDDHEILQDGYENLRIYNYTSAVLLTRQRFFFAKYEIRCRFPKGNGFWPAFWLFGGERYNELDIFDGYGGTGEIISNIMHAYANDGKVSACSASKKGYDLSQWNTFTCEVEPHAIRFLVNNDLIRVINRVVTPVGHPLECGDQIDYGAYFQLQSYPLEPMELIMSMGILSDHGPAGSVPVDDTTPFPASFDVDYVKVWKRAPNDITIWPNPAGDQITVTSSNCAIKAVEIRNIGGTLLFKSKLDAVESSFNISSLSEGIYILTAKYEGGERTNKLVKISQQ